MQRLLTVPEVAEWIRSSADYVRRRAQRGEIRHVKRRGILLFAEADVQAWLNDQTNDATAAQAEAAASGGGALGQLRARRGSGTPSRTPARRGSRRRVG